MALVSSSNDEAAKKMLKRDLSETIGHMVDSLSEIEKGLRNDGKISAAENCKNTRNSLDVQFIKKLNDSIDFAFNYEE